MIVGGAFRSACVAILPLALAACRANRTVQAPDAFPPGRPIILITIDTLRADRLGSYGSTRGLTPALDRFAQCATRFSAAVSQVPLTLAAHTTLLTGVHPARHGVRTNDRFRLASQVPTLAEAMRGHGYATAAFIGGYPLISSSGLSRGFDRYDDEFLKQPGVVERPADEVVDSALAWIQQFTAPAPAATPNRGQADPRRGVSVSSRWGWGPSATGKMFFAWVHLFDPHSPYAPPAPFAAAHSGTPYDGEVAYTDAAVGRLFERLQRLDVFTPATVVVVADHGESLGEHGERTHGTFLYDSTVRVPLLVKMPDSATSRVVDVPVEVADLAPTLAALAGASLRSVDGQNLLPLIGGAPGDPDRPAYAESYYQNMLLGWSPLRAVRTRRWKFVEAPRPELYNVEIDAPERQNRIDDHAALAAALGRALPPRSDGAAANRAPAAAVDSEDRLRSLGYVSGSTFATPATRAIDPKDRVNVWAAIEDGIDKMTSDPAAAEHAFTRALALDAGNGLALKYLGDSSFRGGRLHEARARYQRAIAAGFRHPDVFVNLASIAEREGRIEEARDALAAAVQMDASDADAWNRLGLLEAQRGAAAAARNAFANAIAAAPDRAEPYYNLAVIERRAGNEALAQARLRDAVARNTAYPEAQYELGTGYLLAMQPDRALEAYRAALAARPDYPEALFGAARAALDLGRTEEARRDYERFVRVAPVQYRRQVAAAREALRELSAR
jgi:choline-sulfatase